MKTISIILCSRDRAEHLKTTLVALARVLPKDDAHIEIVLIDNASTDDTSKVIADFAATRSNVKTFLEPTPGRSIALNRGARESTGELIVCLDDDVVPQPGWLENLTLPIIEGRYDATVGRIELAPHLLRDWMTPFHRGRMAEMLGPNGPEGECCLVGANMALPRSLLEKTSGYDPELGAGRLGFQEESLLTKQIFRLGGKIGYVDNAVVVHHFEASRLKRKAWLSAAEKMGRSSAFVVHHWFHAKVPFARLRRWRKWLHLSIWRLLHRPDMDPESEGIDNREVESVQMIAYLDQYQIERHRPHCYDKDGVRRKY